jgi:hypothetical protein
MKTVRHAVALGLALLSFAAQADPLAGLEDALTGGHALANLRLRYEQANQDESGVPAAARLSQAQALTLRTRLGYDTGSWYGFDLLGEFSNTSTLGGSSYNSTLNGKADRLVIADPAGTTLDQAFLRYRPVAWLAAVIGRQRLIYDDARFIGNVGFRQQEQTYDAASLDLGAWHGLSLQYAYLANVNTITFGNRRTHSHLIHVGYAASPMLKLAGYAYLLDFLHGTGAPYGNSATYGARAGGVVPLGGRLRLGYLAEYAIQRPYAGASSAVHARYFRGRLALLARPGKLLLGYELLSGNGQYAFQTPLATVHAYQGWADLFIVTPPQGIRDAYAGIAGGPKWAKLMVTYHDFRPDAKSAALSRYGSEWDGQVVHVFDRHWKVGLTDAYYHAAEPGNHSPVNRDFNRFWAWLAFHF